MLQFSSKKLTSFSTEIYMDANVRKAGIVIADYKYNNLQYNTVGRWSDGMIIPLSDGPMFILIDWE